MKKIFLALFLVAASGVCGYSREVSVILKNGVERKGELTATDDKSVFIRFKNGKVKKFDIAEIDSVIDKGTNKDILSSIQAASDAADEKTSTDRDAAGSFPPKASNQKALPDNIMGWMSRRYDAKTMLGFKWENPDKAKIHYALEKNNFGGKAGFMGSAAQKKAPGARLDLMQVAGFFDESAWETTTNSYIEIKYTKPGARTSWNIGYIKYSETRDDWISEISYDGSVLDSTDGDKYRKTEASVLFASLVLAKPAKHLSCYAYGGPAIVSYDYTETGGVTVEHTAYPAATISNYVTFNTNKSATAVTWILGIGGAFRFSDKGLGVYMEYKHMPATGYFAGMDNFGLGLSFGF